MPLFEFVCDKCGERFDSLEESPKCVKCASIKVTKQLNRPNFCIKGSCANPLPPITPKKEENKIAKQRVLSDWVCDKCGEELIDEYRYPDEAPECPKCKSEMRQKLGWVGLNFKYNPKTDRVDWDGNTTQYWSAVKKARREGRDVKGFNEN